MGGPFLWGRAGTVARREFLAAVRRPAYLVMTLGMPFFFAGLALLTTVPGYLAMDRMGRAVAIGVVDRSGFFDAEWARSHIPRETERVRRWWDAQGLEALPGQRWEEASGSLPSEVLEFPDEAAARAATSDGRVTGYFVVPEDYLESGVVSWYAPERGLLGGRTPGGGRLVKRAMGAGLLGGAVPAAARDRVLESQFTRNYTLAEGEPLEGDEWARLGSVGVPYAFAVLLVVSLMMSSTYLVSGVVEEKETRVIEVLLASVSPEELLAGKLVGLGGAGLLQLAVWVGIGVAPAAALLSFVEVGPLTMVASFVYFLLGFLLCGSLTVGFGALGGSLREAQQVGNIWGLACALPFVFLLSIADEPNGAMARVLSYFPLTAPVTLLMRLATGQLPWWELPLSALVLLVTIVLALRVSARLFRIGLLLYGKRPGLREVWRWVRASPGW
ncbi:MAG: ABC transporter permease [Planctomycetes bacterium]|nr:ABC transporter permease [Planctomycetota bacterium]